MRSSLSLCQNLDHAPSVVERGAATLCDPGRHPYPLIWGCQWLARASFNHADAVLEVNCAHRHSSAGAGGLGIERRAGDLEEVGRSGGVPSLGPTLEHNEGCAPAQSDRALMFAPSVTDARPDASKSVDA